MERRGIWLRFLEKPIPEHPYHLNNDIYVVVSFLWQHLHAQYDELIPPLCNGYPDIFPPELYTWEKFLWACELWYSNSMKIMYSDGKLRTCLIPLAGFLNHSVCEFFLLHRCKFSLSHFFSFLPP